MKDGLFLLGLTGSIAMGKSTTAAMFAEEGIPLWDADEAVARLYSAGGSAARRIEEVFGAGVLDPDGSVSRPELWTRIKNEPEFLAKLEEIVHPLVDEDRRSFVRGAKANGATLAVLEIPLLFEKGLEKIVDAVVVVTASEAEQRERAMARPEISEKELNAVLGRQIPDADKRRRADFVISTSSLEDARAGVRNVLSLVGMEGCRNAGSGAGHGDNRP